MSDKRVIQQFVKGELIVGEGTQGDRTYRILAGEVLICKYNELDEMIPIAKLGPGEIFGEMYMFEENRSRSASVVAASAEVKLEVMFQDEMIRILGPISPAMVNMLMAYNDRLKSTSLNFAKQHPRKKVSRLPNGQIRLNDPAFRPGYPADE